MAAPTLQFVDSIASSPTVRLDLNAGDFRLAANPDFSPPGLREAIADSGVLRDGSTISASAYDNRVLGLPIIISSSSENALATSMQALHRELDRPTNILKYNAGQTNPVFFRTFRAPDYALDMEHNGARVRADLQVAAEPFAYGLREDLGLTTITCNPAVTNGFVVDYPTIKGDVDTPAIIVIDRVSPSTLNMNGLVLAMRQHGTVTDLVTFMQAESLTIDTGSSAADALASGGSAVFGNNALTVSWFFPATGASQAVAKAAKGTYRVVARARTAGLAGTVTYALQQRGLGGLFTTVGSATIDPHDSGLYAVYDFGLVEVASPDIGFSDVGARSIEFRISATAVGDDNYLDYVGYIPADGGTLINGTNLGTLSGVFVLDGVTGRAYVADDVADVFGTTGRTGLPLRVNGGFLSLRPGQTNRLISQLLVVAAETATFERPAITNTFSIQTYYYPRYLYVNPGT